MLAAFVAAAVGAIAPRLAVAQETRFFRIGTAAASGTYFPIGAMIANVISNPPGARDCDRGGSCGVSGLIAVAQASQGSVENVQAIAQGRLESGLTQADVAYWAYTGTGTFEKPLRNLRAVASLFPETLHLVVSRESGIRGLADLKGKRISLGERNSGTLVDTRLVLELAGLTEKDVKADYLKVAQATQAMRDGALDGFFLIAGYPVQAIAELISAMAVEFVPISAEEAEKLHKRFGYFTQATIPADTYPGIAVDVPSLAINALWVVKADLDDALIYQIARALWHESSRKQLDSGHPMGRRIQLQAALDGIDIPLHPGAERFYRDVGMAINTPAAVN